MTEQSDDVVEVERISANLTLRSSEGPEIVLEQRYIGTQPIVVIEPADEQPEGSLVIDVLSVDLDQSDLIQLFELLLDVLKDGTASPVEPELEVSGS